LTGATGAAGVPGDPVTVASEPPGANCSSGGVKLVSDSGTAYVCNGVSPPEDGGVAATPADVPNTLVQRDGNGDFAAHTVSLDANLSLSNASTTAGVILRNGVPYQHDSGGTFLGVGAGNLITNSHENVGIGNWTLGNINTGDMNIAIGFFALQSNTQGGSNTAVGYKALQAQTLGSDNTAIGFNAMSTGTPGSGNTAIGSRSLLTGGASSYNVAIGYQAGNGQMGGRDNVLIGDNSGGFVTSGSQNVIIGAYAGTTGNMNVFLGYGVAGNLNESNTIRIGTLDNVTAAYIAGISGATSASGTAVMVNANGQLGTLTSSRRFKEQIQDIGDASDELMKMRPVKFKYKKALDPAGLTQYGLVAEEVAQIDPGLVVYAHGQPETVRYHFVSAMLLNEVQKQRRIIDEQQRTIRALARRLEKLEGRPAR
jgi:hypothetical protein